MESSSNKAPKASSKKSESPEAPTQTRAPAPNLKWRGTFTFRHDLFKGQIASFKRNLSYKKGQVEIINVEHVHHFHSHDRAGKVNKYCTAVGGHFHEITPYVDENGDLQAKCGPPIQKTHKRVGQFQKTVMVPVKWRDEINERDIMDDHTHDMTYITSEEINPDKSAAGVARDSARLRQLQPDFGRDMHVKATEPAASAEFKET